MHPRHRSPGNGYRSSSLGMSMAVASRVSPESSARGHGHGFYNSDYRSFNRGFGRNPSQGHVKAFPPPPPLPPPLHRTDIFIEAGRLAAEYLVSQGVLPASALSGKWQNGNLKKQVGEFQEFRSYEGENMQFHGEVRTSALARLGNSGFDSGSGRRRYSDDYNAVGMRNHVKGKRRGGSFKGHSSGSYWGRDYSRSGSWQDRRASPEMSVERDTDLGRNEEKSVLRDNAGIVEKPSADNDIVMPKGKDAGDAESEIKEQLAKVDSGSPRKDHMNESGGEIIKESDDSKNSMERTEEIKNGSNNDEVGKKVVLEELPAKNSSGGMQLPANNAADLRTLCKFANVPTRIRSSRSSRGAKVNLDSSNGESSKAAGPSRGTGVSIEDNIVSGSSFGASSDNSSKSRGLNSESSNAEPVEQSNVPKELTPYGIEPAEHMSSHPSPEVRDFSPMCGLHETKAAKSESFAARSLVSENDQDSIQGLSRPESLNSEVEKRGEKRPVEENTENEGYKRARDWLSPVGSNAAEYVNRSYLGKIKVNVPKEEPSAENVITAADSEGLVHNPQLLKVEDKPCVQFAQEKQLFPGSFKICDLNLMESSDVNDSHDKDPVLMYPAISDMKGETVPVDIDLSMSNSITSSEKAGQMTDGRAIEVIDLESDSVPEHGAFGSVERKTETAFVGLDGFSNPAPNATDIPDAPDSYGFMLSDLLANDFTNCTSDPGGINPLDNMGLHNGEVPLGDDDAIYMSLGPLLSIFRNWDPPAQEDGKPF